MKTLIIGGSSGLGFEISKLFTYEGEVHVIGRRMLEDKLLFTYHQLDLANEDVVSEAGKLIETIGQVDRFVYAAGFFQQGPLGQLVTKDIDTMLQVGLRTPIVFLQQILKQQENIKEIVLITSTSQWTPRVDEPVYTAVKAGLGMLGNSLSLDPQVGKVLVAGPAGMKTNFWLGTDKDTSTMLDPVWVAEKITEHLQDEFKYKFIKILRQPTRVELIERR